jgi:PilZ domain
MTEINLEKRKYPRHKIQTQAMLEMFDGSLPVSVTEMSVVGLRIQAGSSIEPETHIAIRINVDREIVFHGQVVWVADMMTVNGHVYNMGIQMDAILDRGEEIIALEDREILVQDLVIILERV